MKPVDCHCHIDFDQFEEDREEVLGRAREKLEFVIDAGCGPGENEKVLELSKKYEDFVVPNLGLHPTHVDEFDRVEKVVEQIRQNDPAAVGEIGLDHHHVNEAEKRETQEEVFRSLLSLAEELGKPVVVHSRDAEEKTLKVLDEYGVEAMIHCFNGSVEQAERACKDHFIGVTSQVLYSSKVQKIVEALDLEDIVLETDSPFLYPEGRNEPVKVVESAEKIAKLKNVEVGKVVEKTTENAHTLFRNEEG